MKNGRCPKCESHEIYHSDAGGAQRGLHVESGPFLNIYKDKKFMPDIDLLEMHYYVCQQCGYFEMYVKEMNKLGKLSDSTNWHRV